MTDAGTLEALLNHAADKPAAMARLAQVLVAKGKDEQARDLCRRAIAMAPEDPEVHALSLDVFSHDVADWYFPMVQDSKRHAAYEKAMRRRIKHGCTVLEIRTGTGLLAMMASVAGVTTFIACATGST